MKIGIVCYPTYGGSGVVATELGKALAKNGHEVHFITYTQPHRLEVFAENIYFHEVQVTDYPLFHYKPYELALASKMVHAVMYEGLDILHVHYAIPHASSAYMAKQILRTYGKDIPVVTTLHGTDITLVGKDSSYEPVVTFSINQSDAVTAVSDSLKKDTESFFKTDKEIVVIPNFVDPERFKNLDKDHFKRAICPNGEKLLVHTSNFREVKRVGDVVRVFDKLRQQIPAKLLLVGDGPERDKIEKLCREMGTCEDIRFLGKIDSVEEVLAVSDLFIMPSETESFGLAALEAMACGVPLITTNTGGLPEVNIHGVTGFLSNVGDVDDMAKNAITILDVNNLARFKEAALKRAADFDVSKVMPMYEKLYKDVLEEQRLKVRI